MRKYPETYIDPRKSAKVAGLIYKADSVPGLTRKKKGKGFIYLSPEGRLIRDRGTIERISKLVIPPAWEKVWISPDANSHLQATGIDARGRKQYLYHSDWNEIRNQTKFDRMIIFAGKLPLIRKKNRANLKIPGIPAEKVFALITEILDKTFIRIGNEEYEKENNTFGITTMRNRHVKIKKDEVEFKFIAKSGKESSLQLKDKLLAKLIRKCREIPGYHLFQYYGENGVKHEVQSQDVNNYLKEITGEYFTAKDFRTWAGTVNAFNILKGCVECETDKERKQAVVDCIKGVADNLNNTVAICKKYYIHPKVLDTFSEGLLRNFIINKKAGRNSSTGLSFDEKCVLKLLKRTK